MFVHGAERGGRLHLMQYFQASNLLHRLPIMRPTQIAADAHDVRTLPLKAAKRKLHEALEDDFRLVRAGEGPEIDVIGDTMTFKLTGADTGGQFALIAQANAPGTGIPMHVHDHEDEVFRVISGTLLLQVAGEVFDLRAGDVAFCPRGIPHAWRVTGEEMARVDLSIFPAGLEHMFEAIAAHEPGPPAPETVAAICGRYGVRFV